jgi:hypothetical protein
MNAGTGAVEAMTGTDGNGTTSSKGAGGELMPSQRRSHFMG